MKIALITGITGQDGYLLTEFLLKRDYLVFGFVNGQRNDRLNSFLKKFPSVQIIKGDLTDFSSVFSAIALAKPDEIYNLGALSFVGLSFTQPEITADVTGLGILRILEAVRKLKREDSIRIYQASSSEMFGKVVESPQNENTPFYPRSPYGSAKCFAHHTSINYREAYNMFISSGILFNHESEYRGYEFVTRKITSNLARLKLGLQENFSLGLLTPKRDWGYAGDYVDSMWRMLQHEKPDTFVIATGKTYSIKDFLELAFEVADIPFDLEKYIKFDQSVTRPTEVELLVGDYSKAKKELGWAPKTDLKTLVSIMVENDLKIEYMKHKNTLNS